MLAVSLERPTRGYALAALAGLAALGSVVGCSRCGSNAATSASSSSAEAPAADASVADAASGATTADDAGPSAVQALPTADVPEIKDTGSGRATAALRAALTAYGVTFDAATIERDCNVDDDGASLDDLEDAAMKYGLEAGAITVPAEHVLLPEAKLLPAIVMVDSGEDQQDFVLAWRLAEDRVQVMTPDEGRKWIPRADFERSLHVEESTMPVDELREAMGAKDFTDALVARMTVLGEEPAAARALLGRAVAEPSWRGLAALDASIRELASAPADAGRPDGGGTFLTSFFDCATSKGCDVLHITPAHWWVRAAAKGAQGEAQVSVRGAVLLAIVGRATPAP
jgi:hypothetical protein